AERGRPGSTIGSVGDGLWWAITTMTTVGYGDRVPVTIEGRCIAAGLMLGGVALLGVLTGTFASWLVAEVESTSDNQDETRATVRALADEVRALRNEVTALRDDLGVRGASHTGPATGRDP
ncbi:potassium channel family protein, partial [Tsukamurella sp. 8J]